MMEQVPSSCCRKSSLPFLMPFVLFLFMKMPKSTGSAALSVMSTSTAFGQSVVAATSVCVCVTAETRHVQSVRVRVCVVRKGTTAESARPAYVCVCVDAGGSDDRLPEGC